METLTRLLDATTSALGPLVPRVLGALSILVVAWLGARLVRAAALRGGAKAGIDDKLHSPGLVATLAGVASALCGCWPCRRSWVRWNCKACWCLSTR